MSSDLHLHPAESHTGPWRSGTSPPPRYSTTEERNDRYAEEDDSETEEPLDDWSADGARSRSGRRRSPTQTDLLFRLCVFIGVSWTIGLYSTYPSPTTIPVFVGSAFILASWVVISWIRLLKDLVQRRESVAAVLARCSTLFRIGFGLATGLVIWWIAISLWSGRESGPIPMQDTGQKFFIAVNLHNNENILNDFIKELTSLTFHLGRENLFISIYESNSRDRTQTFLHGFDQSLSNLNVDHRILTVDNDPGAQWPYGTSPERIKFLAHARNMAMEPLQSPDDSVRLPDWEGFTKVIFLNDIQFRWQDIVRLIGTRIEGKEDEEYDLACAMDFGSSGLYDTWVARDICGAPLRTFWPFAHDPPTQQAIRDEQPFEVATCWNGAVVFNAKPFLYSPSITSATLQLAARGWKAIDEPSTPGSRMSPPLTSPIHFRTSGIDACDHSECFLFSYDLHRLYNTTESRPRIIMNPAVRVAYEKTWYHWHNVVLRRPVIRWWLRIWSHNVSYRLFDWPFEHFGRRRDYCTWSGLKIPTANKRCPPLPRSKDRPWNE